MRRFGSGSFMGRPPRQTCRVPTESSDDPGWRHIERALDSIDHRIRPPGRPLGMRLYRHSARASHRWFLGPSAYPLPSGRAAARRNGQCILGGVSCGYPT